MRRVDRLLLGIVLLGLALRLAGLHWGLPSAQHFHSYHPDEIMLVRATLDFDPLLGDFDPGFYNYGSLNLLLPRLLYDVGQTYAPLAVSPGVPFEEVIWKVFRRLHLIGRLVSILAGTATLVLVYGIGCRLAGRTGGLASALLLAIAPMHVVHSHYFTVDAPAAFFVAAALWASLLLLEVPRTRTAALTGVLAGLAAATKYNMALVILAPLVALGMNTRWRRSCLATQAGNPHASVAKVPRLAPSFVRCVALPAFVCLSLAVLGFLAGCPGVILNTPQFMKDFLFEVQHVRTGHGLCFVNTPPGWIYHVTHSLRFGLGVPLLLLVLAGVGAAAVRRHPADRVLAAWGLPYYLLIGAAAVKFQRYTIPLLPVLTVWAGVLCARSLTGKKWSRWRTLACAGLVGTLFWTLSAATAYDLLFVTPDPRDRAAEWVQAHVPRGATVALAAPPWFQHPPLVPWNGGAKTREVFLQHHDQWPYLFLAGDWTAERLEKEGPDCFILSDLETRDALRLDLPETLPIRRLVEALEKGYRRVDFPPVAKWPDLFGPGWPPEDWLYPAPTIFVYLRRDQAM